MPEKKLTHSELSPSVKHKLTAEEQIEFLERKLEEAKLEATDKRCKRNCKRFYRCRKHR